MKKAIAIFIVIFFTGIMNAQLANSEKSKTIIAKDTVKNKKILLIEPELKTDSIAAIFGKIKPFKNEVFASYYHDKFNGKKTASGKLFSNEKYTAAHRKLPFGTMLKITNEANGKYVVVEVIDRGPFSKGREIDLSRKAYKDIAVNKNSGIMKVKIEIIEP